VTSLAKKFNVGVCDLARLNGLMNPDFIYTGEPMIIPSEAYLPDDYSCLNVNDTTTTAKCIYGGPHVYTTLPGDTIQKIANERYGITVDSILNYTPQTAYIDNTKPGSYDLLQAGQTVKIPLCADSQCVIETFGFWYGTGPDLARIMSTTVGQIMALNPGFNHSDGGKAPGAALTMPVNCTVLSDEITVL
jgi:LysM repeat protein